MKSLCCGLTAAFLLIVNLSVLEASNFGVITTLDLAEDPNISYNSKAKLALEKWVAGRCTANSIWFRDQCHDLNAASSLCAKNENLILNMPAESQRGNRFPVELVCREPRCSLGHAWYAPQNKCIFRTHAEEQKICGANSLFDPDMFDLGICTCESPMYRALKENGDCGKIYQESVCPKSKVLVHDPTSTVGKCIPDLCFQQNEDYRKGNHGREENNIEINETAFAPLHGNGKCLKLNSHYGCKGDDVKSEETLVISYKTFLPECEIRRIH